MLKQYTNVHPYHYYVHPCYCDDKMEIRFQSSPQLTNLWLTDVTVVLLFRSTFKSHDPETETTTIADQTTQTI